MSYSKLPPKRRVSHHGDAVATRVATTSLETDSPSPAENCRGGTTEEILTWGACKWGLDADVVKAVAVQESDWRQSTVSDESTNPQDCVGGATPPCPTSFGIMQLK